ncbi:hypothetical protein [Sphingomonas jeddahensis]|uniref:Uncharacterized protein n=1 Tax=Sphingomonas jeddahensis TaxID=1915074 RepID=A0A1V2EYU9_9SPHN|nr:hypothetical protein [Sphingomonas jeddahensis]ONF97324.1 hypothetical protein SPHI_07610 [Sphingomonas jeddahensis]
MTTADYISTLSFQYGNEVNGENSLDTLPAAPKLIAEREADMRIERLNQVWGHADATVRNLSHKYRRLWDGAITELADYKGTIYVT